MNELLSEKAVALLLDRTPYEIRLAVAEGRFPGPCRELEWSDFWHRDTIKRIRREMAAGTLMLGGTE